MANVKFVDEMKFQNLIIAITLIIIAGGIFLGPLFEVFHRELSAPAGTAPSSTTARKKTGCGKR